MQIRTAGEFLDYWDSVRARTRRVVACIPPDRLEWTHRDGAFTLGDLVRHLAAIERHMGAGVVDLYFDFTQNWGWSYGVQQPGSGGGNNAFDYYLYSQGREGVSPWDKPEMYMFESALTHVPEVTAPFLIMYLPHLVNIVSM